MEEEKTCKTCVYFEACIGICKRDEDFVTGDDTCSKYENNEEE